MELRSIRRIPRATALVLAAILSGAITTTGARAQQPAAQAAPIRALYVTGGGFHDFVAQEKIIPEGLAARVPIQWTIDHTAGTATDKLIDRHATTAWADEFDLVVYNMSFSFVVDPAWIDRIAHTHRDRGIPAVILHGATGSSASSGSPPTIRSSRICRRSGGRGRTSCTTSPGPGPE